MSISVRGEHTFAEIMRQPECWSALAQIFRDAHAGLEAFWQAGRPVRIYFAGCGSAYFAGQSLAVAASDLLGVDATAQPASEMMLFPRRVFSASDAPALMIALSRSGETSETLAAVRAFRAHVPSGRVLSVTCAPDSTLAKLGDMAIDVGVREQSIVQTGSLTSMALFVLACLRLWSGQSDVPLLLDRAAAAGDALLRAHAPLAEALGTNEAFDRFFWLGSGMNRGFASEAMLKVKEMSFCQSEAYHTLEFRHGLGANAAERSLIAVLHTESIRAQESDVLSEMYALGVHTLALNAEYTASTERAHTLTLDNLPLPDWMRIPVFMPVVHLIGYHRALLNGRDPDKPENLHSFITLKALPS